MNMVLVCKEITIYSWRKRERERERERERCAKILLTTKT
jgi:hypothetical protein